MFDGYSYPKNLTQMFEYLPVLQYPAFPKVQEQCRYANCTEGSSATKIEAQAEECVVSAGWDWSEVNECATGAETAWERTLEIRTTASLSKS
jgi:hypothetical protein